jgi:hypothetical protein
MSAKSDLRDAATYEVIHGNPELEDTNPMVWDDAFPLFDKKKAGTNKHLPSSSSSEKGLQYLSSPLSKQ